MFGTYRTLLAVAVVVDHFMALGISSSPAVYGFFCLSGFLMTMLMQGPYAGRAGAFFLNRFLRLFPVYWCALALVLIFTGSREIPSIAEILLIDTPHLSVAWALTNELVFYVLIGLGISRTLTRSLIWLVTSIALTAALYLINREQASIPNLYFPIWAGSLPFAAGAVLFHSRDRVRIPRIAGPIAATCITITMIAAGHAYYVAGRVDLMMLAVYASLPFHVVIVAALSRSPPARIDDLIGRLSYPIYLLQMPAFYLATRLGMPSEASFERGMLVLAITIALALGAALFVDVPVQRLRDIVRRPRGHQGDANAVLPAPRF
jgi:peptidoglycan/LPS O-acetylase OafA/YrhL